MVEPFASEFQNRRVTVMGLGSFGGGLGAALFFARRGALVTVTDLRTAEELADSVRQLGSTQNITLRLGGHDRRDFERADLLVINPAVAADNQYVHLARAAGVPCTSEMRLFWQHQRGKIAAVTGSNGKSTTTAMLANILRAAGQTVHLGGNIGVSLLPDVEAIQPGDWVVLELSSFQLEDLNQICAAPDVAVVTNFSPNHLDRHGSMDAYRTAKQSILRWQTSLQTAVLNDDDDDVRHWPTRGRRWCFGHVDRGNASAVATADEVRIRDEGGLTVSLPLGLWLKLPGRHNFMNAVAATTAAWSQGISPEAIRRGIETYTALPHRLQFIRDAHGRRFYNDSLATTPESAAAALKSFDAPIVLLAGGYDKGVDLAPLVDGFGAHVKAVALMGQTAQVLEKLIHAQCSSVRPVCRQTFSLEEAFNWSVAQSSPGDIVLLSPACASYDWFSNFAARGERFIELVRNYAED